MVNILAMISPYTYADKVYAIIREVEETSTKAVYVSLNKAYLSLIDQFKKDKIDSSKFFFVDTITATVLEPEPVSGCLFLPGAEDTKKLYAGIIKAVKENDADTVIFDSVSSLTTYSNTGEIIHFITALLGALSSLHCAAVFTCLSDDQDTQLVNHMKMKVDKIYEYT